MLNSRLLVDELPEADHARWLAAWYRPLEGKSWIPLTFAEPIPNRPPETRLVATVGRKNVAAAPLQGNEISHRAEVSGRFLRLPVDQPDRYVSKVILEVRAEAALGGSFVTAEGKSNQGWALWRKSGQSWLWLAQHNRLEWRPGQWLAASWGLGMEVPASLLFLVRYQPGEPTVDPDATQAPDPRPGTVILRNALFPPGWPARASLALAGVVSAAAVLADEFPPGQLWTSVFKDFIGRQDVPRFAWSDIPSMLNSARVNRAFKNATAALNELADLENPLGALIRGDRLPKPGGQQLVEQLAWQFLAYSIIDDQVMTEFMNAYKPKSSR